MGRPERKRGKAGARARREAQRVLPVIDGVRLTAVQAAVLETAQGMVAQVEADVAAARAKAREVAPRAEVRLTKGQLGVLKSAEAMVRRVQAELVEAREAAAVADGVAEVVGLDLARGADWAAEQVVEPVWRRDGHGAVLRGPEGRPILDSVRVRRMRRVDGLDSLYRAGALDERDMAAAQAYRALQVQADCVVASGLAERDGGAGAVDTNRLVGRAYQRALASLRVTEIRKAIEAQAGARALEVFDAVVGHGASIRSVSVGGDQRERSRDLLVAALRVCRIAMPTTGRVLTTA